jgi:hypothetical protein
MTRGLFVDVGCAYLLVGITTLEWRKRVKFERMYKYEAGRRVASDKDFELLRKQFDMEISELNDLLAEMGASEHSRDPDEWSDDFRNGYCMGFIHGRDQEIVEEGVSNERESAPGIMKRVKGHLTLLKGSNE